MDEHQTHTIERHCDVAIIGGSAAGLAAALQLGRQRRSVIVIDAGEPRNAPASRMHSNLGHEGIAPSQFAAIARDEVRSYGGEVLDTGAIGLSRLDDGRFRVEIAGGHCVIARRVLAATGIIDELPDIDGLAQHWGGDVIHCPFCHGYEVRDRRIVQIVTDPMGLHTAGLFRQLSADLTLVLHDGVDADQPELDTLRAAGVTVIDGPVRRVTAGDDGRVQAVELVSGDRIAADSVAIGSRFRARADIFTSLGLTTAEHLTGLGDVVETDPSGETTVRGLYAAGNITDPSQQVLQAAAQGSRVGGMISFSLAHDDIVAAARPSANATDWDHRYDAAQMWSGNPNGPLVDELSELSPGTALDVGAGEGGDAVWLAEHGWRVTAADISQRGLDRIAAVALDRGLAIDCLHADANGYRPFAIGGFDVVSAHYASIPRTPDDRAIHNMLDAVAPGGTLLVVSHDIDAMRAACHDHQHEHHHQHGHQQHGRPFDPDAYVRVDDVVAALTGSPNWEIELHDKRPRAAGSASAGHHVDDIVLRARRTR